METADHENHKYLCWLNQVRGITRPMRFALLEAAAQRTLFDTDAAGGDRDTITVGGDRTSAARLLYTVPEEQLRLLCCDAFPAKGKGERAAELLLGARKREPDRVLEELQGAGITFISFLEEGFPMRLRKIPDPPSGLYCRGRMPADSEPAAAVIGARLASGYGRAQAKRFAWRLGSCGIPVISGMARGIDGIAQAAALDAGGTSYAVLGSGADICYPKDNRALYDRLLSEGGILSEYPPGTPPEAKLFPPRNRIISGLSDLILVIEARKKSGTLITVDMALEQGREVYALPGRVSDSLSEGCNRLIRQGAGVATCPEDILEFFFGAGNEDGGKEWDEQNAGSGRSAGSDRYTGLDKAVSSDRYTGTDKAASPDRYTGSDRPSGSAVVATQAQPPLEAAILRALSPEDALHLDRILESVNQELSKAGEGRIGLSALLAALMRLGKEGRIREEAAGYYMRIV